MTEQKFWVVWNPNGNSPVVKHWEKESADREAERLASVNPGNRFYVLKSVSAVKSRAVEIERIKLEKSDNIPF